MPWKERIIIPGVCHHIVQRGNNKQEVFHDDAGYKKYSELLRHFATKHECKIGAYCLMPNHVHLIIRPPHMEGMARMMQCVNVCYQQYLSDKSGFVGHVWQSRYFSAPVEDGEHLCTVCAYIDTNPLRAALVTDPCAYEHSSALAHEQGRIDHVLTEVLFEGREARDYYNMLHGEELNRRDLERIRLSTQKGHPIGGSTFRQMVERLIGRSLAPRPMGRPRTPTTLPPEK
jgi:putative transposase